MRIANWCRHRLLVLICFLFVLSVAIREGTRLSVTCPRGDLCGLAENRVKIEGEVVSLSSERLEKTIIEVEGKGSASISGVIKVLSGKIQVTLPHAQYNFYYGDQVILEGGLKLPNQDPKENFSYPLYLAGKGIYSTMYYPDVVETRPITYGSSHWGNFYKGVLNFRERIRHILSNYLIEPDGSILKAMLIGDQGSVPQKLRRELSEVGVIHILSVSGTHITLAIAIITFFVSKFTLKRSIIFGFTALGVAGYLLLAGSPSCASRSAIMGLIAFLALSQGRQSNFKTALWLSAAVLLYFNPAAIFSDVGFELSFLAIIGMVYVYPLLDKSITWGRIGFCWKLVKVFLLSVSISLTTTPLVFYYFGIVSWISPITNLILLPLFSLVLPAGFLLLGLGLLAEACHSLSLFYFLDPISKLTVSAIHSLLLLTERLTSLLLKIPGSYSEGTARPGWVILYYALLFLSTLVFQVIVKKHIFPHRLDYFESEEFLSSPSREDKKGKMKAYKAARETFKKCYRTVSKKYKVMFEEEISGNWLSFWSLVSGFLLLTSVTYLYSSSRPPSLAMLDVGQGDAMLLNWPRYHFQILIDGGPGRNVLSELGETLPFYDRKIELLILSHPHQDHLEGLITLLDRYETAQLILNSNITVGAIHKLPLQKIFWQKLVENKVSISIAKRNQRFYLNKGAKNVAEFRFLTPLFDYSQNPIADINDNSAVLEMNYPRKILFMGDAQSRLEKIVLSKESHNIQAEILKIGHHGSRFSTSDEFLDYAGPDAALISVGKNNFYGHPAVSTLKKLEDKGIKIYRTDKDGRVILNL